MDSRRTLSALHTCAIAVAFIAGCGDTPPAASAVTLPPVADSELRDPAVFDVIADKTTRSRALFVEASRVIKHARCSNCHPSGDVPLQGDVGQFHDPPVVRGADNHGVAGLECTSCHQDRNLDLARVPGAPHWALAPLSMAWVGKSTQAICEQLKDKSRNGDKNLAQIVEHTAHDPLVAWGFQPGANRVAAPGSQARFGALMAAWVATGAECPEEERP